jgi:hypothetical protein
VKKTGANAQDYITLGISLMAVEVTDHWATGFWLKKEAYKGFWHLRTAFF